MLENLIYYVFVVLIAGVACWDFMTYKIPNTAIFLGVGLFALNVLIKGEWSALFWPIVTFVLIIGIGFFGYIKKWIGAGDVKLLAVCGLWMAPTKLVPFFITMSITGGVLAYLYLNFSPHIETVRLFLTGHLNIKGIRVPANTVPYGLAICAGVLGVTIFFEYE